MQAASTVETSRESPAANAMRKKRVSRTVETSGDSPAAHAMPRTNSTPPVGPLNASSVAPATPPIQPDRAAEPSNAPVELDVDPDADISLSHEFKESLSVRGIRVNHRIMKPYNWEEISKYMARKRTSPDPSLFSREILAAFLHSNIVGGMDVGLGKGLAMAIPLFLFGFSDIPCGSQLPFDKLIQLTPTAPVAKPQFYDGIPRAQVTYPAPQKFNAYIAPSKAKGAPVLPNKSDDNSLCTVLRIRLRNCPINSRIGT